MAQLDYCSHGKRLLKAPHENCNECEEIWDYTVAIDCLKTLTRILSKRIDILSRKDSANDPN